MVRRTRQQKLSHSDQWHVGLIVENVPLGSDHRLRKQAEALLDAGYRVSVLTMRHPTNEPYRGRDRLRLLEYPPLPQGRGAVGYLVEYFLAFFWVTVLLLRLHLRARLNVVQFCQPPDIYFPIAWLFRRMGVRIVVDQRDLMPELLAARYEAPPRVISAGLHALERITQRVTDVTVTVNTHLRDRLLNAGAAPQSVVVVMNGPVLERCDRVSPDPALRRGHDHLIVWVGKMGRQDRVDLVVRLAEALVLRQGRTDCGFVLIGDGECLEELRGLTAELSLQRWVHFVGWAPEQEVFAHLATADVGLDTSMQVEVTPVKAIEYMAFRLPFACFDLQETRRLAQGAALFAAPGEVAELSALVRRLLEEPARRRQLGSVGRARVESELAWERQAGKYLAVLGPS